MSSASCGDSTNKCQHCQQLEEQVDHLAEVIEELQEELAELKEDQADHQEHTAKERAEDRKRMTELEDRVDDVEESANTQGTDGEDTDTDGHERPQTPLEQTAALPQEMIDEESPNTRRAVFVARDATDYTTKVPAGRAIKSSELRKVLKAGTDCNGHTQTVSRVMEILDRMGKEEVQVVDRRGQKRVVFSEDIVDRLKELGQPEQAGGHRVVMGQEV